MATADGTPSPHSRETPFLARVLLFPLVLLTTLSRMILDPSVSLLMATVQNPLPARCPRAPLCQLPNGLEWLQAPEIGKPSPTRTEESLSSLQEVQSSPGLTLMAMLTGWFALLRQSEAKTRIIVLLRILVRNLDWPSRRCVVLA